MRGIADLFKPLEALLKDKFIPAITGHSPPLDNIRDLFALPTNCGGLRITKPTDLSFEFEISEKVSAPLVALIVSEQTAEKLHTMNACVLKQKEITAEMRKSKRERLTSKEMEVRQRLDPSVQCMMTIAKERGASSWLSGRPVEEHGFVLHKAAFRDAIALQYGWDPLDLPTDCACGETFSSSHALSCPNGGRVLDCP